MLHGFDPPLQVIKRAPGRKGSGEWHRRTGVWNEVFSASRTQLSSPESTHQGAILAISDFLSPEKRAIILLRNRYIVQYYHCHMKLRIGPPVTGEDFYPRPQLIQTLARALNGGHVAFLGPRRTGKTSCLKSIVANPPDGYVPLLLNLEKHHSIGNSGWLIDSSA